ncbi:hypothetical protein BC830DRAFT_1168131 [Chytriomyces sp. MP71]|nr:hypothetical protein BC830DRAFT_1168131 [Chytriomyces sp. MP71]
MELRARFERFMHGDEVPLHPEIRGIADIVTLATSDLDKVEPAFEFLLRRSAEISTSAGEKKGSSPQLLERLLTDLVLNPAVVRFQDLNGTLFGVVSNSPVPV